MIQCRNKQNACKSDIIYDGDECKEADEDDTNQDSGGRAKGDADSSKRRVCCTCITLWYNCHHTKCTNDVGEHYDDGSPP